MEEWEKILKYKIVECDKCKYWFVTKNHSKVYCPKCNHRNKVVWKTGRYLCKVIRYSDDREFLEGICAKRLEKPRVKL